ncbi:MAG TPA: sulfatase-like hydrolase/transferase [Steroidobacteraceae bacterium]|nr:sulfatase-like hydrolase/transferase [Steroidobacteraceae bacterium]
MTRWPWYAAVFAAYPLLYIAAANPGQVETPTVALAAAAAAAMAASAMVLLRWLLGSWGAAGLGVAWLAFLFFAYGPVNEWWLDFVTAGVEQRAAGIQWYNRSPQLVHSIVWALIAAAGLYELRRRAARLPSRLTAGLNLVAALLAVFVVMQGGINAAIGRASQVAQASPVPAVLPPSSDAGRPDIYFIVLDGYARADVLREYYGFDNTPFLDGLRTRGFQVADASRSNFSWTFLSLGSALNFEYVQPLLGDKLDPMTRDRKEMYRLIRDSRAAHFLKEQGYRTVQLQSTWGGTGSNPHVDEFLACDAGLFGDEYLRAVADASWLRALESKASMDIANCHLQNFEALAAQASRPGPKFVLAHFVPPHHPYLFDREGNVLRRANISDQFEFQKRLWEDRVSYVDQLLYVNRRIGEVVDRILSDSPHPPVIVLVSDHGPNLKDGLRRDAQRRIRFANLTAMFLPGAGSDLLPPDATPVNHLRRIFNEYFDAGLPILPDRYFASTYEHPYGFLEIGADDLPVQAPAAGF